MWRAFRSSSTRKPVQSRSRRVIEGEYTSVDKRSNRHVKAAVVTPSRRLQRLVDPVPRHPCKQINVPGCAKILCSNGFTADWPGRLCRSLRSPRRAAAETVVKSPSRAERRSFYGCTAQGGSALFGAWRACEKKGGGPLSKTLQICYWRGEERHDEGALRGLRNVERVMVE